MSALKAQPHLSRGQRPRCTHHIRNFCPVWAIQIPSCSPFWPALTGRGTIAAFFRGRCPRLQWHSAFSAHYSDSGMAKWVLKNPKCHATSDRNFNLTPMRGAGCKSADLEVCATNRSPVARLRKFVLTLLSLAAIVPVFAEEPAWQPAHAPVMTRWAADVSPTNALPEYPRPQLVRPDWMNLNGLWDYAVTSDSADEPASYAGKILVPFPVESALSGVMAHFDEHSKLWYHRTFSVPQSWRGQPGTTALWRCGLAVRGLGKRT